MTESKKVTAIESDIFIQALCIQKEIIVLTNYRADAKSKINALKPEFDKMKDTLIKHGKYTEADFKVRGT